MHWFLCVTLLINVFTSYPLVLKRPELLEKKQVLASVLVFEHIPKQRQLIAQINNDSMQTYLCDFARNRYPVFLPYLKIFKSKFLIQDLIS